MPAMHPPPNLILHLFAFAGLEADLFYVHEGAINTYAMHFTVPVPADVHELEFSWQSLIAYPVSHPTLSPFHPVHFKFDLHSINWLSHW